MNDPQRQWEAFYQELVNWCSLPEFKQILRSIKPEEVVVLLRAARRLDLLGDHDEVRQRVAEIEAVLAEHERWAQRTKDASAIGRIFIAIGGVMAVVWAFWDRLGPWLMK